MALKFYLDTHVAKAVAEQLRISGLDVIRCEEVGMSDASDEDHLAYATREQRIILSQDDSFMLESVCRDVSVWDFPLDTQKVNAGPLKSRMDWHARCYAKFG